MLPVIAFYFTRIFITWAFIIRDKNKLSSLLFYHISLLRTYIAHLFSYPYLLLSSTFITCNRTTITLSHYLLLLFLHVSISLFYASIFLFTCVFFISVHKIHLLFSMAGILASCAYFLCSIFSLFVFKCDDVEVI